LPRIEARVHDDRHAARQLVAPKADLTVHFRRELHRGDDGLATRERPAELRDHGFARLRVGQCLRDELADGVGLGALRPAARVAALAGLEAAVAFHRVIRRPVLALFSGPWLRQLRRDRVVMWLFSAPRFSGGPMSVRCLFSGTLARWDLLIRIV